MFKNCSNYAPVIDEEQEVGTKVITVHAEIDDVDGKFGRGNVHKK